MASGGWQHPSSKDPENGSFYINCCPFRRFMSVILCRLYSDPSNVKRRFRTNFTEAQSVFLEESFQESHYPDQAAKREMARMLDLPEDRITVRHSN